MLGRAVRMCCVRAASRGRRSISQVPGIAFDIDGVLLRGKTLIPGARETVRSITPRERGGTADTPIPHVFLTNGGGMLESVKARNLSEQLGVDVSPDQVILAHTPMQNLAPYYRDVPILAIGMSDTVEVARSYGFTKVVTSAQLVDYDKHSVPLDMLARKSTVSTLPPQNTAAAEDLDYDMMDAGCANFGIGAIFVFYDPRDWYVDLQIACDVLTSSVHPALRQYEENAHPANLPQALQDRPSPPNVSTWDDSDGSSALPPATVIHGGASRDFAGLFAEEHPKGLQHVPIYFSNPDLVFSGIHEAPRLAQGAFNLCLGTLYESLTGRQLIHTKSFGKPNPTTYRYAERKIQEQARSIGYDEGVSWFIGIGDNPAADIRGANLAGPRWRSVLVETGTIGVSHREEDLPDFVCPSVQQALDWVLTR